MSKRKTRPLAAAAPLASSIAACLAATACGQSKAAHSAVPLPPAGQVWLSPAEVQVAHIQVATVDEQNVDDTLLTSGTVTLEDTLTGHVFSPVSGRVVRIDAELGAHVKKGDPLAVIESPDIGSTVSDVHKAQAALIAAEHDLTRKKDLFEQHAASEADVETAEDVYRTAKAEIERARQKQFLLHVGNVDGVTQTYTVAAPVDGEVLMRNINPGMEIQGQYSGGATPELFTIGELATVWVLGDVYEVDLARIHVGAHASVTALSRPNKVYDGKVDWVSGMLDPNTRTAKIRCTFDNASRELRPQMYATIRVSVDERRALAIPRQALQRLGDYKLVFVEMGESDGHVAYERLPVDVDERPSSPWLEVKHGLWLEVKHGLEAGQRVVIAGATTLAQRL
jgi:cobalt-zinc-cadmium efflux system membrane fusion protein